MPLTVLPLLVGDAVSILFACLVGSVWPSGISPAHALLQGIFSIPVTLAALAVCGLYPGPFLHPAEEWRRVFWSAGAGATVFATGFYFHTLNTSSAVEAGLEVWLVSACTAVIQRSLLRKTLAGCQWWGVPTVVIAGGHFRARLLGLLDSCANRGLKVVDWVDHHPSSVLAPPALNTRKRAARGDFRRPEYALIATGGLRVDELSAVIHQYRRFRQLFLTWDMDGIASLETDSGSISDLFGVSVRQNLAHTVPRIVKRCLDILTVATLAILLSPILIMIWALVKLSSPGPALYGHRRIGRSGEHFTVWKFRTMSVGADRVLSDYLDRDAAMREEWRLTHKLKRDPRNTPIGAFLRRTSLDELPQLWNVLRGEMSLVGPRPM